VSKYKNHVLVLGSGAWGTALAQIISKKFDVLMWVKEKKVKVDINQVHLNKKFLPGLKLNKNILSTNDLEDLKDAKVIFLTIPVQYMSSILRKIKKIVNSHVIFVCCSKGIEMNTLKLPSQIVASHFPKHDIAVLSGPNFAEEISRNMPAATLIASKKINISKKVASIVQTKLFRPYISDDVIGSQIAGATKNVYAIACGIVEGKKFGKNAVASIISRSFAEISRINKSMKAKSDTLSGLSGMGDLFLTCSSKKSRNFRLGLDLANGLSLNSIVKKNSSIAEGVFTARSLKQMSNKKNLNLPIAEMVYQILYRKKNIDHAIEELLNRPIGRE
tara:strand:+ start:2136 stop:3131 length:996 start_codon:yes stop_codon:yes gene_type:complete